jgi:hypothetical protein
MRKSSHHIVSAPAPSQANSSDAEFHELHLFGPNKI